MPAPLPSCRVLSLLLGLALAGFVHAFAGFAHAFAQSAVPVSHGIPAGLAALLQPLGLAFDAAGNLYIAEASGHRIRRLDPNGELTLVAGTLQGFSGDSAPAVAASLDAPHGLALDPSGNLYIADTHNHRIRRLDAATATLATVAGTGVEGFAGDNGPAKSARLAGPTALALGSGGLYIADTRNHRIRRLDLTSGNITTIAGTGTQGFTGDGAAASLADLNAPSGLALDAVGGLYIADTGNHRVRFVDPTTHTIRTAAGSDAAVLPLLRPMGLALAASGLLIADAGRHELMQLDLARGALTVLAGQGSQSFSGDAGPAGAATLDTPSALAISPTGVIALADTGNGRVREIDPTSAATITTAAGLGTLTSGGLSLAGASVQRYGSVTLTASLSAAASGGTVSLLDATASSPSVLAQVSLAGGAAVFQLPSAAVGVHRFVAAYAGDGTHRAAQSQQLAVTVAPCPLTATIAALAPILYGQPLPALGASLTGALAADTANLNVLVSTSAAIGAAPGVYPVHAALSGSAAGNYTFTSADATLTIAKAPVAVSLLANGGTLTVQVASSTLGVPTGGIILLTAAGTRLASAPLSAAGTAALSSAGLPEGDYQLTAIYSGDTNFLSAQSSSIAFTLGVPKPPADFALTGAGALTQTVNSGEIAQFTFAVQTTGSLAGPVTLSASGLPPFATASITPSILPPGGAVTSFKVSITTARSAANRLASPDPLGGLLAFAVALPLFGLARRRVALAACVSLLSVFMIALSGCGARINSAATAPSSAKTYPITVTGTTTRIDGSVLQHTATVTLTVQ